MDFNAMIQNTTHLEEYAVPVSVLLVFLLLIHQRHRLRPATASDFEDERHRRRVRPSGRVQRAASIAIAAAAADMDELDADETADSIDSEGALEYPPSPSDSMSSNAEAGFFNGAATRASSLYSAAEESIEAVGVRDSMYRSSPEERESSTVPGAHRGLPRNSTEDRRFLPSGSRSVTATSTAVRGTPNTTPSASQIGRFGSRSSASQSGFGMSSRAPQASSATSQATMPVASSRSVQLLQPKVEPVDDLYVPDRTVPISTPLPPKRASTPRTPTKARGSHAFTPEDNFPSDDAPPPSSPLPPKQFSASARTSFSASRDRSLLSGPSSAGSRASVAARSRTVTPSASMLRASSHMSGDATLPPSSVASSASVARSRARSRTPDRLWTPMSRMSSLTPTPSEDIERWDRKASSRTVPSTEDADDETERVVVTAWFESSSSGLIEYPPDLRDHPDLQLGDLFYHYTPNDYQLWIWEVNDDGMLCWVRVKFMSVRNGMYLTLTPGERRPSWVSQKYAHARKRDLRRQGYEV